MDNERSRMDRDHASGAWNRQKLNERIEHLLRQNEPFCVLLVSARNLRRLERQYSPAVMTDALRDPGAAVRQHPGRGSDDRPLERRRVQRDSGMDPSSAMALSTEINRKLSMSFPVWTSGVAQMLTIETSTGIVDRRRDSDPSKFYRKLEQMAEAMAGPENKPAA